MKKSAEEQEEGGESFKGSVECEILAVVLRGTVEVEETVVATGDDVVEVGSGGAEAFVEVGAGKGDEVCDGLDSPGEESLGEFGLFGSRREESLKEKGEGGFLRLGVGEGVEVSEIGGGGVSEFEREGGFWELRGGGVFL